GRGGDPHRGDVRVARGAREAARRGRGADEGSGAPARLRAGGRAPRPDQGAPTTGACVTLEEKLARLPDRPGVYLYRDAKAQVIYVGKAASLRSRVRSYFQESRPHDAKTDSMVRQIADLEYIVTDNELEALMLEANLVRKHRPRYNITVRDVQRFLEGKDEDLLRRLTEEMEAAAVEEKFERAAVLRDQIQSLNKVLERQKIISTEEVDQDVVGVVRQGNDACVELFFVR